MTSTLLPLAPARNRTHGWMRQSHYRFSSGDAWAPLLLAEITSVLPFYPLAFVCRPPSGFQLVALQGLYDGENLFLDVTSGQWHAIYVPSYYRGYPFTLREMEFGGKRDRVICFDHASNLYRETPNPTLGEERFFDDVGKPSPLLQQVITFLNMTFSNRELTNRAVDSLAAADLIVPWELPLESPEPGRPLLGGLYRVNETALNTLDGQTLAQLRDANGLTVAYAQLFSVTRVRVLRQLYDRRTPAPAELKPEEILETFLGSERDDLLQF